MKGTEQVVGVWNALVAEVYTLVVLARFLDMQRGYANNVGIRITHRNFI